MKGYKDRKVLLSTLFDIIEDIGVDTVYEIFQDFLEENEENDKLIKDFIETLEINIENNID